MWRIMPYGRKRSEGAFPADPDSLFSDFSREIDNFFGQMWGTRGVEMYEKEGRLYVTLETPGVDPEKVEIRLFKDRITVRAAAEEEEKKEEKRNYYCRKSSRNLDYEIVLPFEIDPDKAQAEFKNGLLTLSAPRLEIGEGGRILRLSSGSSASD